MLKFVHLGPYLLRPEDFGVVTSFLRAIGFNYHLRVRSRTKIVTASRGGLRLTVQELPRDGTKRGGSATLSAQISIEVSHPEVIRDLAERMKLAIETIHSESRGSPGLRIELPGKLFVHVSQKPAVPVEEQQGTCQAQGKRFAIVVSRFNAFITERLLSGALDALSRSGASKKNIAVVWVPGAFEIPAVARTLAASKKYDAIICLGCLLRGDTAHYDVIATEVSRGIGQSAQETGIPHAFGVLTCDSLEQAIDRAGLKMGNKGFEAALAAIETANLTQAIAARRAPPRGKGTPIHSTPGFRRDRRRPR